ncbi:MAG: ABC transporter permease [Theionarchaea archaeon]|nr:ABC transporter permease [Theionarchaea archaeon]
MMNSERMLAFTRKNLKQIVREPASLFLVILFPVVLTLVFGISFGGIGGEQSAVYDIGVVTLDAGTYPVWALTFVDALDSTEILIIRRYETLEAAQNDLIQGSVKAVLVIPERFGESCTSFVQAPENPALWVESTVDLFLDSGSMFATQAIPPIIQQVLTTLIAGEQPTVQLPVHLGIPSLIEAESLTVFDYFTPGIFAFAVIFLTMIVAQTFTVDREKGLLRRINTTPASPFEVILGYTISNMGLAVIQVAVVFAMAFLVGYSTPAGLPGLFFAFVIVMVFALCSVGFGLITASIAKTPGAATGISFVFIVPQMFLGTFVSVGLSSVAQTAGKFVPSYYVTDALTSLLLRGAPVTSQTVVLDFVVVTAVSIGVLMVGALAFRRYGNT